MNRPLPLSSFNCVPFLDNAYDVQTQTQQVYRLQKVIITQKLLFWNFRVFQFHKCLYASQQSYFDEKFFSRFHLPTKKQEKKSWNGVLLFRYNLILHLTLKYFLLSPPPQLNAKSKFEEIWSNQIYKFLQEN